MKGCAIAVALLAAAAASAAQMLTPAEKRGREVYLHGKGAAGPITAFFGKDQAGEVDASLVPCASCHGADGRGVPEGTVAPPDIRWSVLSNRYDAPLLARAVRDAVGAAGTPLFAVMPRFRLDARDLDDLVAYLRRLGSEPQPGLQDDAIVIGSAGGDAVRAVITGYFDDVNESGGLFGRRLRLETIDSAASAAKTFGLVCADEPALERIVEAERIPLVTPFVVAPESRASPSSFFIFPDLESEALALVDFVAETAKRPMRVAIVHDGSRLADAAARSAAHRCTALGWTVSGSAAGSDLLLLIGNVDVEALAETIRSAQILVAGASISKSLFDLRGRTVLIAAPTLPSDVTDEGLHELESFAARHHLDPVHRAAQIAAYAAVKVFVEALRRGGRDVTREKVIASLEHLYGFVTGVTPPITYGTNRHVGAVGAYVVALDAARRSFGEPSRWITPAE